MRFLSVLPAAVLVVAVSAAAHAQNKGKAEAPKAQAAKTEVAKHDLDAKIAYCKTCHGVDAQGFRGSVPMPRLAGQQPDYLKNQLQAFIEHRRTNPVMGNVAHVLTPAMLDGLAEYFQKLNPKPLGGAPKELVAEGKKIYQDGIAATDVPACASCHGPDAKGHDVFPRLAGQLHDYIIRKFVNFSKERGQDPKNPDTSAIMEPITHNLTEAQIKAVAAYLSYLE
jgi:cytochrome c553